MSEADKALENEVHFECKKDGLQQRQNGDWMLRFTVQAVDMDQRIAAAMMGTRYQCVLVEIGDDETPVDHKARERDKWRDLGAVKQSVLRGKEPVFWAYLKEEQGWHITSEEMATHAIREICGIASRGELGKPGGGEARLKWHALDNQFQAWRAREHG